MRCEDAGIAANAAGILTRRFSIAQCWRIARGQSVAGSRNVETK
jgi:hypothetical protein